MKVYDNDCWELETVESEDLNFETSSEWTTGPDASTDELEVSLELAGAPIKSDDRRGKTPY